MRIENENVFVQILNELSRADHDTVNAVMSTEVVPSEKLLDHPLIVPHKRTRTDEKGKAYVEMCVSTLDIVTAFARYVNPEIEIIANDDGTFSTQKIH